MTFDPQKFFIGLMDFFSILLPGALLTWLLMGELGPVVLGDRYCKLAGPEGGAEAWAVFLFASYLFGHLVFLLGAWWLDEFYDWCKSYTLDAQIALLARHGRLLPRLARALIWLVFKGERNLAVDRAARIKQQSLAALQAKDALNTFQWSKAWLNVESPASLAVVQRFEADSKFFRCFTIVLILLLAAWPLKHEWSLAGVPVVLVLFLLALWRYMEQRHKASNQAYWSVITLTAKAGKVVLDRKAPLSGAPTHAGGVVYRICGGVVEYLLVTAKGDARQWVLPKGHIEEGEQPRETAVREVREETGVWARIQADLGVVPIAGGGAVIKVQFFLMERAGAGLQRDANRASEWLPIGKAKARANFLETRELLAAAESRINPGGRRKKSRWQSAIRFTRRARRLLRFLFR